MLGRLYAPDDRDSRYPLRALLTEPVIRRNQTWYLPHKSTLFQGDTGTCVGHGAKALLMAKPRARGNPERDPTAYGIYRSCVTVDEWSENDAEAQGPNSGLQYGTSVRAAMKVLAGLGFISAYRWAYDVDTIIDFICAKGPVVIGVNWYYSMFDPDAEGFLHITPNTFLGGGHCVTLLGWNQRLGYFTGVNSWDRNWGLDGRFRMPPELLARLLAEYGDACAATEQ